MQATVLDRSYLSGVVVSFASRSPMRRFRQDYLRISKECRTQGALTVHCSIAEFGSWSVVRGIVEHVERCGEGGKLVVDFVHVWYFSYRGVWVRPLWIIWAGIRLLCSNSSNIPIDGNVDIVTRSSRVEGHIYE